MIVVEILKWLGQCPKSIQVLVISINLTMHSLSLRIILMCHQDNLFRSGTDELLHFSMAYKISVLEKVFHEDVSLVGISFNRLTSTC